VWWGLVADAFVSFSILGLHPPPASGKWPMTPSCHVEIDLHAPRLPLCVSSSNFVCATLVQIAIKLSSPPNPGEGDMALVTLLGRFCDADKVCVCTCVSVCL
jgi:hypothetical protein